MDSDEPDHDLFDENTSVYTVQEPPLVHGSPSVKYGIKLTAPVVVGFILLAFAIVVVIMYCCRRQITHASQKKEGERMPPVAVERSSASTCNLTLFGTP